MELKGDSTMVKNIKVIMIILIGIIMLSPHLSYSGWIGPQEVLSGTWGTGVGQFYYFAGDSFDFFPKRFGIDTNGNIFINDKANKRIQIFDSAGTLKKVVMAPSGFNIIRGWPYDIYVHPNGSFIASYEGPQKFFFDNNGNFVKKVDVYGPAFPVKDGYYFYVSRIEYPLYTPRPTSEDHHREAVGIGEGEGAEDRAWKVQSDSNLSG